MSDTGATAADATPELLKIGEVAERVGLSLRSIRFYEEEGLIVPDARSAGGFRLYTDVALTRLGLVKRMKPLGFSVEEMREILGHLDELESSELDPGRREKLVRALDGVRTVVEERAADLVAKAARGRELGRHLCEVADAHR